MKRFHVEHGQNFIESSAVGEYVLYSQANALLQLKDEKIEALQRQLDAAHEALRAIRHAGNNTTDWATWAQRTAAWGMEPHKWPKQDKEAPE